MSLTDFCFFIILLLVVSVFCFCILDLIAAEFIDRAETEKQEKMIFYIYIFSLICIFIVDVIIMYHMYFM